MPSFFEKCEKSLAYFSGCHKKEYSTKPAFLEIVQIKRRMVSHTP
jgi:hypothetical protein